MTTIRPGQIYEPCDPRERSRLRVQQYIPGAERAYVTDVNGKRPRLILVKSLHVDATTRTGKPRRTGYRLIQDVEETK